MLINQYHSKLIYINIMKIKSTKAFKNYFKKSKSEIKVSHCQQKNRTFYVLLKNVL